MKTYQQQEKKGKENEKNDEKKKKKERKENQVGGKGRIESIKAATRLMLQPSEQLMTGCQTLTTARSLCLCTYRVTTWSN